MVHALRPRVVIINNGTRKGGQPDVMKVLHSSPGLEDLWQIHFSQLSGQEYTVPGMFIANLLDQPSAAMPVAPIAAPAPGPNTPPPPAHNGPAYWIKLSAKHGRLVHRHQCAQRIHQDLRRAQAGHELASFVALRDRSAVIARLRPGRSSKHRP